MYLLSKWYKQSQKSANIGLISTIRRRIQQRPAHQTEKNFQLTGVELDARELTLLLAILVFIFVMWRLDWYSWPAEFRKKAAAAATEAAELWVVGDVCKNWVCGGDCCGKCCWTWFCCCKCGCELDEMGVRLGEGISLLVFENCDKWLWEYE